MLYKLTLYLLTYLLTERRWLFSRNGNSVKSKRNGSVECEVLTFGYLWPVNQMFWGHAPLASYNASKLHQMSIV